ncbi:MAG: hypothetical protein IJE43_16125 [Alphaproteobacteria bacterium]|nr:hypothetical protein [Alphaproteobacteria bacterium]
MKKRFLSLLLVLLIGIIGVFQGEQLVFAEEPCGDISMDELKTDGALIGQMQNQTWGVYLASGESVINKISSSKVGAGGTTNAARKCTVRITSILEKKNSSGNWVRVMSWTQTNEDSFYAGISKSVTVPSGYYYRVRSYHYASTDSATSYTNALWVGN